ncbi:MAG: UDP-2,3-diacylglucosamine diphosphatase [Candidatus Thioglobus sp.]|nr:UDP-2,3-diacylglucosamine diphosphatase [Candidatus Thioglobus sp.]
MPATLIISDLHLVANQADSNKLFIKFAQQQAVKFDQLFILGDLFNTWIGDDLSIKSYAEIVKALGVLSRTTEIFVMVGNRDFLLGAEFAKKTKAKLIETPYLLQTGGQDYVLTHGDELCTDDENYQQLKKILQHPLTKFIFLHLPKKIRLKLSGQLRKKSIQAQKYKPREIMDVNQIAVDNLMRKYPGANLIHGHTHRQNTHSNKAYSRYVLGDWSAEKGNAIKIMDKIDSKSSLSWLEIS